MEKAKRKYHTRKIYISKKNSDNGTKKPEIEVKEQDTKSFNFKSNNNKNLIIALVVAFVVFFISILFIPELYVLLKTGFSKKLFYLISILFSGFTFYGLIAHKFSKPVSKYVFLSVLIYSISINFIPANEYSNDFYILYLKLKTLQTYLVIPGISLGIVSIWLHKEKLRETVNKLFHQKEIVTEKTTFKEKLLKPITNLFSKKEIFFTIGLFIVIGITIFTLFYRLDYFDLYSDEAQVTKGAAGYYHTGEYKQWSFIKEKTQEKSYNRATSHLFLVAQSYKIFGINNWASRFPSALFGVILIILTAFISRFFTKSKIITILVIFSFSFFFDFLLLQRWSRMYAILMPIYMITFYFVFKFLTEKNTIKFIQFKKKSVINKYFNFNYLLLPVFLLFFYISYNLHANSLILLPILFVSCILIFLFTKEKKYLFIIASGVLAIIFAVFFVDIFPDLRVALRHITFFEGKNSEIYTRFIFGYPFSYQTNLIFIFTGLSSLFIVKNNEFRKKYLMLIASAFISWITFAYFFNFSVSFRYVSFAVPFSILLVIGFYILTTKTLYNKFIQGFLIILLISSVLLSFKTRYKDLYVRNFASPARPSIAYTTINNNLKPQEALFRHWGPEMYFDDIDTSVVIMSIGHYKDKSFNKVFDELQNFNAGWLTWHTHNSRHINSLVNNYANVFFKKYHGWGIDATGVEVYYYNKSMLKDTSIFKKSDMFMPIANLNTKNTYSIATWLTLNLQTNQTPYYFHNFGDTVFTLTLSNGDLIVEHKKDSLNIIRIENIATDKLFHIVYYQTGGEKGDMFGIFINGKKISEKTFKNDISELIKIQTNQYFNGNIEDIRIYNFVLSEAQIGTIMQNKDNKNSNALYTNNKKFETLFHWQKR